MNPVKKCLFCLFSFLFFKNVLLTSYFRIKLIWLNLVHYLLPDFSPMHLEEMCQKCPKLRSMLRDCWLSWFFSARQKCVKMNLSIHYLEIEQNSLSWTESCCQDKPVTILNGDACCCSSALHSYGSVLNNLLGFHWNLASTWCKFLKGPCIDETISSFLS